MSIYKLFCDIDDFCIEFMSMLQTHQLIGTAKSQILGSRMSLSEVMTIIVLFHQSDYRTFKHFYTRHVCLYLRWAFPTLVSYNRFVELMQSSLIPLYCFLNTRKGQCSGISFLDSMPIMVCHNQRIHSRRGTAHKVFKNIAQRGKDSVGYFYGFKLHLIINDKGELLGFHFTPGNVDDREPVPKISKNLFGKIFADRGYISQKLFEMLFGNGIQLITKIRKT